MAHFRTRNCYSISSTGKKFCSFLKQPDQLWGPLSLLFNGCTIASFLGVKQPRRDTDHIRPSSAKVKNGGKNTSNLPHTFIAHTGTVLPLPLQKLKIRSNVITTLIVTSINLYPTGVGIYIFGHDLYIYI